MIAINFFRPAAPGGRPVHKLPAQLLVIAVQLGDKIQAVIPAQRTHRLDTGPLQLLADYVSCAKGLDVDKPRNLAKSVTVE